MQTMTALLRVNGSRDMTVQRSMLTPAEAWLLMHVHDASTKDVFEEAVLTADVARSKTDERTRLHAQYPEQYKLIESLFPGRTASDVPDAFAELVDVPLEVAIEGRRQARHAQAGEVEDATADDVPFVAAPPAPVSKAEAKRQLSKQEAQAAFGGKRK